MSAIRLLYRGRLFAGRLFRGRLRRDNRPAHLHSGRLTSIPRISGTIVAIPRLSGKIVTAMNANPVFPRNSNCFFLQNLTDMALGTPITDAVTTWEIRTAKFPDGAVVASGSGTHVSGNNYRFDVPNDVALTAGKKYIRRGIATSAAGVFDAEDEFTAQGRTAREPTS
jgi:hypothetical protein